MGKSIRIKTTPGGGDKYVSLNIEQDFDFLEVLSVKIRQEDVYRRFCADYGVVVGRVILNDGFGAPNAKVSVFIPLDEEDEDNTLITSIYPFKSVTDQNDEFIRYNLLPDSVQNGFHKSVGTFPSKRKILKNDVYLDVYDKYYKFTTTTNSAGDFMLFGVPVGQQTIHFDLDLSDMGDMSLTPADLIASGVDEGEFSYISDGPTGNQTTVYEFKGNTNLDILPQIKSTNIDVSVQPFWGDIEQCQVGITRLDWQVEGVVIPSSIFFGSVMSEDGENRFSRYCDSEKDRGFMSAMGKDNLSGVITIHRVQNGASKFFKQESINDEGVWAFSLPMDKGMMITDANGERKPSNNDSGIPTYGDYRFEFILNKEDFSPGTKKAIGRVLIPNYPNKTTCNTITYTVGSNPPTHSLIAPYTYMGSISDPDGVQTTYTNGKYLGYFHERGYLFYYRFKAGRIYSTLQNWNLGFAGKFLNDPVIRNTSSPVGVTNMPQDFNNELVGLEDSTMIGCLYFPQFRVAKDGKHCENLVWGSTKNPDNSKAKNQPGGHDSYGPYYYIQACEAVPANGSDGFVAGHATLGRTDIKDLTIDHNFFTDGFATLQNGLAVPGVVGQVPIPNTSANTICNNAEKNKIGSNCYFVYFGINEGNTSLDLVKEKYNV